MNFGKAIRIARSIADVSQGELAARTSLDRSYLSLIESEKRNPSTETLQVISTALGMPFHLMALLATEQNDTKGVSEAQVNLLATELTRLLMEGMKDDGGHSPRQTAGGQSQRSGVSSKGKKGRASGTASILA